MIWKVYLRARGTIGVKAIAGTLKAQFGHVINHKRVARLMQEMNLRSLIRNRPSYTGPVNENIYANLVERDFDALLPNTKWVADLTEFDYHGTKFFACAILDLFDRQAVAFELSTSPDASLVIDTVRVAARSRKLDTLEGLILHTDQGSVFQSRAYRHLAHELKFLPSMSRKANCWDNAVIESFFSHVKTEFPHHSDMKDLDGIEEGLKRFITYYNEHRGQKRLRYLSPTMYYQKYLDEMIA